MSSNRQSSLTDFFTRPPQTSSSPASSSGTTLPRPPPPNPTSARLPNRTIHTGGGPPSFSSSSTSTSKAKPAVAPKKLTNAGSSPSVSASTSKSTKTKTTLCRTSSSNKPLSTSSSAPKPTSLSSKQSYILKAVDLSKIEQASTIAHEALAARVKAAQDLVVAGSSSLEATTGQENGFISPNTLGLISSTTPSHEVISESETAQVHDSVHDSDPSPSPITPTHSTSIFQNLVSTLPPSLQPESPTRDHSDKDIEMGQQVTAPETASHPAVELTEHNLARNNSAMDIESSYEEDVTLVRVPSPIASSSRLASPATPTVILATPPRVTPPREVHREARDGPDYDLAPSGSPLSSLGATTSPNRLRDRRSFLDADENGQKPKKVKQVFEGVEIPVPKWSKGPGPARIRHERSAATANLSDPIFDAPTSRPKALVAAEEEEEGDVSMEAIEENSAEDEAEDEDEESEESEDEDIQLLLAKAAARIAAGKQLAPSDDARALAEAKGAPTYGIAARVASPEVRRSTRAPVVSEKVRGKDEESEVVAGLSYGRGKLGFDGLLKEHKNWIEQKGKIEAAKAAMQESSGFSDSDGSESDHEDGYMKLKGLTEADVDAMVNKVDQGADADAPSPVKRNARETAALFAGVLKEESRRTQAQADPAGEAAREARTVWTATRIARREELPVEEGWKGRIAKAINDANARTERKEFPAPIHLFSRLSGRGCIEDHKQVAIWLLNFMVHPATTEKSAQHAEMLLSALIDYAHKASNSNSNASAFLSAADFTARFVALGAREASLASPSLKPNGDAMEVDSNPQPLVPGSDNIIKTDDLVAVPEYIRDLAVRRILNIIMRLSGGEEREKLWSLFSDTDTIVLAYELVQLALDPSAAPNRGLLERALQLVVESIAPVDTETRFKLFKELCARYLDAPIQTQLETLRALPHRSTESKSVRRWLAWAFFVEKPDSVTSDRFESPPPMANIITRLEDSITGPYRSKDSASNIALHKITMVLSIALTNLHDDLYSGDKAHSKLTAGQVKKMAEALKVADYRLRADIKTGDPARNRAKNAIMRLSHSLFYQHGAATGYVAGDETYGSGDAGGDGGGKRKKPVGPEAGQTELSFGAVPAAPEASTSA